MKKLLLVVVLALIPAPVLAQGDSRGRSRSVRERHAQVGWTSTDRAWTKPARTFFILPDSLVAAYHLTHIGSGPAEFQVTEEFIVATFPTDQLREAAFTAGRLRAEPATSGSVRTCTIP